MYTVKLNGQVLCHTDWPPRAQAAWIRASRDRDSAQRGGVAELWKGDRLLTRVQPETLVGHPWPDREVPESDLRDVLKVLLLLLRDDGWDTREIADAMTERGLPTTRARIDALRGSTQGKRTQVTAPELVTLIDAVLSHYKQQNDDA
ncbi:hypothetical protein LL962_16980 [Xanthomonas sp. NCPPB 1067]|uniref:hypothetical protein n=1 Tax=Xanthomonas sp. NCPPB 1067 TaxID=487524 RepID=UPI001E2ECB7C|nr:hypothetical protein [Xanthomonas sp. NCPPB 1067]MCC4588775.1 hypothetical protein [Xanthomonas sp. NCPPB 1067]